MYINLCLSDVQAHKKQNIVNKILHQFSDIMFKVWNSEEKSQFPFENLMNSVTNHGRKLALGFDKELDV
ncbi:CLUMA_CG000678, isoform A [Clunio marinus]|uniref:CLUMA_CG000678, isoform A n=1 Tax=Clunio marinus TaxID=568069 RepID=A0A1J1HH20_9DIPT|nr:CLUMA_CG000678, isoform A [Clunio marinus]